MSLIICQEMHEKDPKHSFHSQNDCGRQIAALHIMSSRVIIGAVFLGWRKTRKQMPIDVLLMSNCKSGCHWSNIPACRVSPAEGRKECKVRALNVAKAEQVETFSRALETLETVHVNMQTV